MILSIGVRPVGPSNTCAMLLTAVVTLGSFRADDDATETSGTVSRRLLVERLDGKLNFPLNFILFFIEVYERKSINSKERTVFSKNVFYLVFHKNKL